MQELNFLSLILVMKDLIKEAIQVAAMIEKYDQDVK